AFGQVRQSHDSTYVRFDATDLALLRNATVNQLYGSHADTDADRLVALRDRQRMRDAVALYESLTAAETPVPSYARVAAADAYLYLEQPEVARDLYLGALAEVGTEARGIIDWKVALMYAYGEIGQH